MNWLAPNPDMMLAPAPSGNGMLKIIRSKGGGFDLFVQTNSGISLLSHHESAQAAKEAAAQQ